MGVKNFNQLLKKQKCQFQQHPLKHYRGKTLVIDISLYLHKFYNSQGMLFVGMFHQIESLIQNGITPVYVFDGSPDDLKSKEIQKRKQIHQHHQQQAQTSTDKAQARLHENRSFQITSDILKWCYTFLDTFGIQYILATGEADECCAAMVKVGKAHACLKLVLGPGDGLKH